MVQDGSSKYQESFEFWGILKNYPDPYSIRSRWPWLGGLGPEAVARPLQKVKLAETGEVRSIDKSQVDRYEL